MSFMLGGLARFRLYLNYLSLFFSLQRKQRRWTVCPMGAHSKPLLQLDLPFGSPSKSLCENPNSVEFHEELHQRFLHDLREREEENNVLAEKRLVVDRHKNMISINTDSQSGKM